MFGLVSDYITTWRDRYYDEAKKMYPFGVWFCDTNATDLQKSYGLDPQITVPLYYYGVKHGALWVSIHKIAFTELFNTIMNAHPILAHLHVSALKANIAFLCMVADQSRWRHISQ